ncbi:hypothetical protein PIB30_012901 [Stylosanthes scabra]|uniref:Uncharacterized protein n=1 Tax=Stylosanthes scabra TaxID=79078 RepID=A0ABU6X5V5_9FABA|nr:hypothetical protein [Stylosanthes scabra]
MAVAQRPCGPPVAATPVRIAEPSAPKTEMEMDNSEYDSEYSTSTGSSSSDFQEGGNCIPETAGTGCPRYILPTPPPIPRLEETKGHVLIR